MPFKHKQPSLEVGLIVILIVISLFSIGFLSEDKVTGMAVNKVSGGMIKVVGK